MNSGNLLTPLSEVRLGAIPEAGGFTFTLWAPLKENVSLRLLEPEARTIPMKPSGDGYFSAHVDGLRAGALYSYLIDNEEERPDPASRFQSRGVHGPSTTVDNSGFTWTAKDWENPPLRDYIIYELHIGAFTPEGTFDAAIRRIPYLKDLGIKAVEIMPVAQFPGSRNWGYDGVYPFAVQDSYGGPEGLMRLVDALHEAGLAAILDVVYNHLGPEGNYLRSFGPYFTDRYTTPWGEAMNLDGPYSEGVRRFFIDNALQWLFDFRFDALRLDAVHGIFDSSPVHFLREMQDTIKARPGGEHKYLIAESDLNDARLVDPPESGGYGLEGQWSDDFHHCLHTLLTGERDGYYMDFGETSHLAKACDEGFVYTGQHSRFRDKRHGTPSRHIPPGRFVVCCQNHDQIGNRMMGDRLSATLGPDRLRLAAASTILSPYIPLIFMGEEYAEAAPFQYFVSHSDPDLIEAVRRGRSEEFAAFSWKGEVPDPEGDNTFLRSKLNIESSRDGGPHEAMLNYYKMLISLRLRHPALGTPSRDLMDVIHLPEASTVIAAMRSEDGNSMVFTASCFDHESPATFTPPTGGLWPQDGRWSLLLDTSKPTKTSNSGPLSAKIEEAININPMSMSLYEHIKQ